MVSGVNTDNFFVYAYQQQAALESLSNNALTAGMDAYQKKDFKEAAKAFKQAVDLAPQSQFAGDASNYLAMAYLKLNKPEKAIEAYQRWIQLKSDEDTPHVKLGNLYFSLGRHKDAEYEYAAAVRLAPTTSNMYALGQAYLFEERYREAEAEFRKVQRLQPDDPGGYYGLGLAYSRQGRHEMAIELFDDAIGLDRKFYDAYAEKGYAYADMGQMDEAQKIFEFLEDENPELADTLSRYIYKVDPPEIAFVSALESTFSYRSPKLTPLPNLDAYLENANAKKSFKMVFHFDKEMDRSSIEDRFNWKIGRAMWHGPATAYNYGLPVASTEVELTSFPDYVYYDDDALTATVHFTIQQNETADGTIDPAHIEFKFMGEDKWGLTMDPDADQFTGFSGVF